MSKKTSILIASIAIILIIIIGVVVAVVMANDTKPVRIEDDNFIFTRTGDKVVLTKYKNPKTASRVDLPLEVEGGYKVTEIDSNAFKGDKYITDIIVPAGYSIIGESAFEGCENLTNVTLVDVSAIRANAFKDCTNLLNINVNERLAVIGESAFEGCSNLRKLKYDYNDKYIVRSNLNEIGDRAFKDTRLSYVVIPATMRSIGKNAFENAALSGIFFYDGIEIIGEEAFKDATNTSMYVYTFDETKSTEGSITDEKEMLKALSNEDRLPNSLKEIGDRAFYKTKGKSGIYYFDDMVFGDRLNRIGREAFYGTDFASISFKNNTTSIDAYAFSYLRSRLAVTLPANITAISEGLFLGTTIRGVNSSDMPFVVPESVESIGIGAFSGGLSKYKISFKPGSVADSKYAFTNAGDISYLVSKDGSVLYSALANDPYDAKKVYTVPTGVRVIERNAFVNIGNDQSSLVLPNTITTIKAGAMNDLKLTAITLEHTGDMIINIEDGAFVRTRNTEPQHYFIKVDESSSAYARLSEQFANDDMVRISILTKDKTGDK